MYTHFLCSNSASLTLMSWKSSKCESGLSFILKLQFNEEDFYSMYTGDKVNAPLMMMTDEIRRLQRVSFHSILTVEL